MENRAVFFEGFAEFVGVREIPVMDEGEIALDMPHDEGLDIVGILSARGGIAHVPDGDVSLPELVEGSLVENLRNEPVSFFQTEYAVVGEGDSRAFLTSVLQRL